MPATAIARFFAASCCACALAASAAVAEDLTIVSKATQNNEAPTTTTSYYASDRMRDVDASGQEFMAEFAGGQLTMIDNKKKEYSVITRQELEAATAKMSAQFKQMEEQMKSMPPAVREKMAAMMGGGAAAVNVQKGEGGRKLAGYSCDNWTVTIGEMVKQEQCLTKELTFPTQAWEAYKGFASSMSGPMGQGMQQMYDKFKEMNGIPLASTSTVKVLGKSQTSTTEVVEVKKGPIPASAWTIPAGYKKVESPMAKMAK
jgi:hypothetical protein